MVALCAVLYAGNRTSLERFHRALLPERDDSVDDDVVAVDGDAAAAAAAGKSALRPPHSASNLSVNSEAADLDRSPTCN